MMRIADWKDPANYPRPGKTSNASFAWEFLRRNPAYQAAWLEHVAKLRELAGSDAEVLRVIDYLAADPVGRAEMDAAHYADSALWDEVCGGLEFLPEWWVKTGEHEPWASVAVDAAHGRQWGLSHIINPLIPWMGAAELARWIDVGAPGLGGVVSLVGSAAVRDIEDREGPMSLLQSRWLTLQIDLEAPLEVIERSVLGLIRRQRSRRAAAGHIKPISERARSPRLLVQYLRILDARAQGESFTRIGEVLCPHEDNAPPDYGRDKRLKAAHKEACRLRDGGYRTLWRLASKIEGRPKK